MPVVQKVNRSIHWKTQLVALVFVRWIVIYPVDSAIHLLSIAKGNGLQSKCSLISQKSITSLLLLFLEKEKHAVPRLTVKSSSKYNYEINKLFLPANAKKKAGTFFIFTAISRNSLTTKQGGIVISNLRYL